MFSNLIIRIQTVFIVLLLFLEKCSSIISKCLANTRPTLHYTMVNPFTVSYRVTVNVLRTEKKYKKQHIFSDRYGSWPTCTRITYLLKHKRSEYRRESLMRNTTVSRLYAEYSTNVEMVQFYVRIIIKTGVCNVPPGIRLVSGMIPTRFYVIWRPFRRKFIRFLVSCT